MKLLLCTNCKDIFNINLKTKKCSCGRTLGAYLPDALHAWYRGNHAVPLGFANNSFCGALKDFKDNTFPQKYNQNWGNIFEAFVIPKSAGTFVKVTKKKPFTHVGFKCKECGDEIFSFYRHDFKNCSCGKIFVDGGFDYGRFGGDGVHVAKVFSE